MSITNGRRLDDSGFKWVTDNGRRIMVPVTDPRIFRDDSKRIALAALSSRREIIPDRTKGG